MRASVSPSPANPPSREQLLYWLHEASEIEHHLMCCYLYAAFSLKRSDAGWSAEQNAAVQGWHPDDAGGPHAGRMWASRSRL